MSDIKVGQVWKRTNGEVHWEVLYVGEHAAMLKVVKAGPGKYWAMGEEVSKQLDDLRADYEQVRPFFQIGKKYTHTGGTATYKVQSLYQNGKVQFAVLFWEKPNGNRGIIGAYPDSFLGYTEIKP